MKYISPDDFYNETIDKEFDVDGRYGVQCVDLFNYFNKIVNDVYIGCNPSNYAKSIFENRQNNGALNYYDVVDIKDMKRGDWVIWGNCNCSPFSHVAMFWDKHNEKYGKFLGQRQGGILKGNIGIVEYDGIIGVLRPKIYSNGQENRQFLPSKGYLQKGDGGDNVKALCDFMYKSFYGYAFKLNRKANDVLGDYYGENIEAWIKLFQINNNLEVDGCVGPITYAKLQEYGFKY